MLQYRPNRPFKIMQVTDTHLGSYPFSENDQLTLTHLRKAVARLQPDVIIFTGDIIYSLQEHFAQNPLRSFEHFIAYVNQFNVPYVITFGNHDTEPGSGISRQQLWQLYCEQAAHQPLRLEETWVGDRLSFVLPIYGSESGEIENLCFVMDSGDYSGTDASYYAWIEPEQIAWFRRVLETYEESSGQSQHLIFQHIPLPEYWQAALNIQDGEWKEDAGVNLAWSSINPADFPFPHFVASPEVNTGFFYEMVKSKAIWGMFVGHDHDNNFDGLFKGIHLVYGQSSGYNTYGSLPKGVRMIELSENLCSPWTYTVSYETLLKE